MKPTSLERRRFIQTAAQTSAGFWLLPMVSSGLLASSCDASHTPVPGGFLTLEQRKAATALANEILPKDKSEPGAGDLGAADYLETLLTAFDHDPPRIYATKLDGGDFVPLNRYQEAAWRLTLFGGMAPSGKKITGLRNLIPQGLDKAIKLSPTDIEHLPALGVNALLQLLDRDFWQVFSELVLESSFAAPVYGGNKAMAGWKISRFEGDVVGFSQFDVATGAYAEEASQPVSSPNPGPVTDPITFQTRGLLDVISVFTGGRIYSGKSDSDPLPPIPGPTT